MTTPAHTSGQPDSHRSIALERTGPSSYLAHNVRGGSIAIGSGEGADFTPVELLLAAIAGCSAVDLDLILSRRSEPTRFAITSEGHKVKDENGNHLDRLRLLLDLAFPDGEDGDRAREALPRAIAQTRDRLCTVSRTVQLGQPVTYEEITAE